MAINDDRIIPQMRSVDKEQAPLRHEVNEQLRKIWTELHLLQGRSGEVTIRDTIRTLGRHRLEEDPSTTLFEPGTGEIYFDGVATSLAPVHACKVSRATTQAITTGAGSPGTAVTFTAQVIDTHSMAGLANGGNASAIYLKSGGYWLTGGYVAWASAATGIRAVRLWTGVTTVTDTLLAAEEVQQGASASATHQTVLSLHYAPPNSVFSLTVAHTQGANLDISAANLWAFRLWGR